MKPNKVVAILKKEFAGKEVTYLTLREFIRAQGWTLLCYGDSVHKRGNEFVNELGTRVRLYAKHAASFAYTDGMTIAILINDDTGEDIIFLILHEIAHILCGHDIIEGVFGRGSQKAEREANRVANLVLENTIFQKLERNKFIWYPMATAAAIVVFLSGVYIAEITENLLDTKKEASPPIPTSIEQLSSPISEETMPPLEIETPPSQTQIQVTPQPTTIPTEPTEQVQESIPQGQTVWVARTGEVYHTKPDCSYIRGKTDLREMDIYVAIESGLRACSRCSK